MAETQSGNLAQALEGDFVREAKTEHDATRKELETLASQNTEPVAIYDGGIFMPALMIFVGLFCVSVIVRGASSTMQLVVCILVGVLFLGFGVLTILKRGSPALTLTADGILFPGMDAPLPWMAIAQCSVNSTGVLFLTSNVTIWVKLEDEAPAPAISGDWRVRYLKQGHQISVRLLKIRGMSPDRFCDLYDGYASSGRARAALKAM